MILLMAGTSEGRELAAFLHENRYPLLVSTVSTYAASLLADGVECIHRPLGVEDLCHVIVQQKIRLLIDATHPFATEASQNALNATQRMGILYLRWDRDLVMQEKEFGDLAEDRQRQGITGIIYVKTVSEVIDSLQPYERILLTIGSKELNHYAELIQNPKKKVYARVLPMPKSMQACWDVGLPPGQIIACQGPFSAEWNRAMLQQYQIQVLVTKESGRRGGVDEKLRAAADSQIPVVMLQRPKQMGHEQLYTLLKLEQWMQQHGIERGR